MPAITMSGATAAGATVEERRFSAATNSRIGAGFSPRANS